MYSSPDAACIVMMRPSTDKIWRDPAAPGASYVLRVSSSVDGLGQSSNEHDSLVRILRVRSGPYLRKRAMRDVLPLILHVELVR